VKHALPNWGRAVYENLLNLVPAALQSVSEIAAAFAVCGAVIIIVWLAVHLRSLADPSDRRAGFGSALPAGISILGGLVSVAVFSVGDRAVAAIGVATRSTIVFNFWILIASAVLTIFTIERLRRIPRLVFAFALAGFGLCLAAGQVLRADDWVTAWSLQQKMLAEAPVSDLKRTGPDARIVILNPLDVNGAPIFGAPWDIYHAIPWAYPFLRSRKFIMYSPINGPMKWNGKELSYEGQAALEITPEVYLWRPSDISFWRPAGPFVIHQNLTVEQLP
jgi:hypothetical protein